MRGWLLVVALAWAPGCGEERPPPAPPSAASQASGKPSYLGGAVCAGCHAAEARRWRGSHHDLAMQEASAESVLGDFGGAQLEHRGERFAFQRRDGRFFVRTAGADGEVRDFEVTHTFGVEPLQQYLVRLPAGRLQAVAAAWDTRPASLGGQRWFHLQPDEPVPPGDVLHWTGRAGNWNSMCAECHSTNLSRGYRAEDGGYETTWSEIDVSCEACHGPGSAHLAWAQQGADPETPGRGLAVALRNQADWNFPPYPIARRVGPPSTGVELETCARCHARRSWIAAQDEAGAPFLDAFRPALLERGLYHDDGQILDEVYVWGSFLQSRMHAAGVVCSDCHDPHGLGIEDPDQACARCHERAVFAAPAHHRHQPESPGASCVACHMPARTYMVVDPRRDHGFRVPRPDLSVAIGVPNACTSCHPDHPASWAAEATRRWYGDKRSSRTHYAEVLHAGRRHLPGAARRLASLSQDASQPEIVRASALALLGEQLEPGAEGALLAGLSDAGALVRMAAVGAAEALPPAQRLRALAPRLRDARRAVRIEAARVMAPLQRELPDPRAQASLRAALAEYRAAQAANADWPEAHVNLGILHARLGELDAAQREYETAIRLGPFFVPAYVNLAEVHRLRNQDQAGERVLRRALARVPESAEVHHALGLLLVRRQRSEEAVEALGRAARLAPESPRYAYVYGVALHSAGRTETALEILETSHRLHPGDADLLVALATLHRDAGARGPALRYARRLLELRPGDPGARSLVEQLEGGAP